VFGGDASRLTRAARDVDGVEADVALARGRLIHARYLRERAAGGSEPTEELALFERAASLYEALDDRRGQGEAWFWIGCYRQVVEDDGAAAVVALERAVELATEAGDLLTVSYAVRHLGMAEHAAGRLGSARELLERSVELREQVGFQPGVAPNLIGLAYIAAADGRDGDARMAFITPGRPGRGRCTRRRPPARRWPR